MFKCQGSALFIFHETFHFYVSMLLEILLFIFLSKLYCNEVYSTGGRLLRTLPVCRRSRVTTL